MLSVLLEKSALEEQKRTSTVYDRTGKGVAFSSKGDEKVSPAFVGSLFIRTAEPVTDEGEITGQKVS